MEKPFLIPLPDTVDGYSDGPQQNPSLSIHALVQSPPTRTLGLTNGKLASMHDASRGSICIWTLRLILLEGLFLGSSHYVKHPN